LDWINNLYTHGVTWIKYRGQVLQAFERIRPELVAYWELREAKGTAIQMGVSRSLATRERLRRQIAAERHRAAGVVLPTNKRTAANAAALVEERTGETGFMD
jgi:hypothetical protein